MPYLDIHNVSCASISYYLALIPTCIMVPATFEGFVAIIKNPQYDFPKMRGGTVGQDVVELICKSEQKMQQNATFYLSPLLSLKLEFFLMIVPKKLIFGHFFVFLKVSPY